jgi:hypothetical protein
LQSLHLLSPRRAGDHFSDLLLNSCLTDLIMLGRIEASLECNLLTKSVSTPLC